MACIEPDSPQAEVSCYCGQIHRLGELDCQEVFVGWIEDGCTYESERERDVIRTEGAFWDAFRAWNRTGGVLGRRPDIRAIAERECRNPIHIDEAIRGALEGVDPADPFTRMAIGYMAERAKLN